MHRPGEPGLVTSATRRGGAMALALAAALAACSGPPAPPAAAPAPGGWLAFEGNWSAVGERHSLQLGPGRRASVARLNGTLLLTGEQGLGVGFQARALTFSDGQTGALGRAVWTDDRGDQVFSELTGDPLASGRRIAGTIVGGTGRFAGVTGTYELEWQFILETDEGVIQGRAVGLKGRARLGQPLASPPGGGTP